MKIYGQLADPSKGPFDNLMHKLEYKHAVDTILLKNDDLYNRQFNFQTTFGQAVCILLPSSLNLFKDSIILKKTGYILKFAQKYLLLLRITESTWA